MNRVMRLVFALAFAVLLAPANTLALTISCASSTHGPLRASTGESRAMLHDEHGGRADSPIQTRHHVGLDCCQACLQGQAQLANTPGLAAIPSASLRRLPASDKARPGHEVSPVHGPPRLPV